MKKIAIIGTGGVAQTLAAKFILLGHEVMMGTRNVTEKLSSTTKDRFGNPSFKEWYAENKSVKLGTFREAASFGDIIMNITKGSDSISALKLTDVKDLNGKILIDVSNPLDFSKGMPPSLIPELCNTNSLGEEIQKTFPGAKVVKTLNTMGSRIMVNPDNIKGGDHLVFICGNDTEAKSTVKVILKSFGWPDKNILDLGGITSARATEMYLPLWLSIFGATNKGAFNINVVS